MENSQLIIVLRTFSKKEIREFRKWLQSPFHNQRADVIDLFEYLVAGDHLYNEKFLQKEWLFRKIFPQEEHDDAKLRQTIHFLFRTVEDFLAYTRFVEDEIKRKITLAEIYRIRKLEKIFEKSIQGISCLQEAYPFRNDEYYRNEYLIQQEIYTSMEGKQRTTEMNLQEVSDALDQTYFIEKLKQSCRMIFHQTVYKATYETRFLNEILRYIEKENLLKEPAIAIYYYVYKIITQKDELAYFDNLRDQIIRFVHLFPHNEIREIYLMTINYCIKKMNAGERKFVREAFELYRRGFDIGFLIENQNISRWTFRNVVSIGLKLGEFEWVEDFINKRKKYLKEDVRESTVHYSMAKLHFEKKDYDKAMRLLVQVEYDDILMNLTSKAMLLKLFYEQEELDALESLLESMRTYLQRKEMVGYHKSNYQNIIRYTRKLVRVNPYSQDQKLKLRGEIETANPLTEREWLLEQVDAL